MRDQKVMLDSDLAELYQVPTKALNQAVRRNARRFPDDFMFQLAADEETLRSQFVTANPGRGGRRTPPYAFTEHGVAMLSSVLKSERAVQMNIVIVRAFMRMRELLASHKDLAHQVNQLEDAQKQTARTQEQHATLLIQVVQDIHRLKNPPVGRAIGFRVPSSPAKK